MQRGKKEEFRKVQLINRLVLMWISVEQMGMGVVDL
jgi:hypothetical protein